MIFPPKISKINNFLCKIKIFKLIIGSQNKCIWSQKQKIPCPVHLYFFYPKWALAGPETLRTPWCFFFEREHRFEGGTGCPPQCPSSKKCPPLKMTPVPDFRIKKNRAVHLFLDLQINLPSPILAIHKTSNHNH